MTVAPHAAGTAAASTAAASTAAAAAVFLAPGAGPAVHMGSLPVIFKALSAWTCGAYEMHEQPLWPGVLVVPHTHAHQDQVSYVVAGTLGFLVGDEEFAAPAGSFIWRPRGVVHALWNSGPGEARMLEVTSPGGDIENFFRRFGDLTDAGAATGAAVQALAAPYGISYDLSRIADLEARHHVTSGGAWWPE
ncbi:MAG TPA: cupin domain-containing protein [Streptosporangiaceae bacterium]|nr:cupin domain-containing protein [Streptosporangiaceae bacterium]